MNASSIYRAVIFGATSALAIEAMRSLLAERSAELLLIARDTEKLRATAQDLQTRGAMVHTCTSDLQTLTPTIETALVSFSQQPIDLVLIAHGTLPDQESTFRSQDEIAQLLAVNFTSQVLLAARAAGILEAQHSGTIAVFGSVAGDRGRGSNFLYGSAKAGVETFCEGLRHRFSVNQNLHVVLLKPGMTDTPMTAHLPKGPLFSPAAKVGKLAWQAIRNGKSVAYLPGWWFLVMTLIRCLPRPVFHRTKL